METETAREVASRPRSRAGNHTRAVPEAHESHEDRSTAPVKKTRRHVPASEKTHFTLVVELPIAWIGPLKWKSIMEQRKGAFHTSGRENDAQALLRHIVREYCESVLEESN